MYIDEADAQLAREDWTEYQAGLTEEEGAQVYAPQPVPTDEEFEAMDAAMRSGYEAMVEAMKLQGFEEE